MFKNEIVFTKPTRTAQEAAEQIGCEIGQIAKSLIFKDINNQPVLVVTCGSNRVDDKKLGLIKGDAEFAKNISGFVIGGIPPWGHKQKIKTIIDIDLNQYDKIWASSGKTNAVFQLTFEELVRMTGGQVLTVKI